MAGNKKDVLKRMGDAAKASKPKPKAKAPKPTKPTVHTTAPPEAVDTTVAPVQVNPTPVVAPPVVQERAAPAVDVPAKESGTRSTGNKRGEWCSGRGAPAESNTDGAVTCPGCNGFYKPRVLGGKTSVPYHYAKKGRKAAA